MDIKVPTPRLSVGSVDGLGEGWRSSFFTAFFGVPNGPIGWVGARLMPLVARGLYPMMIEELALEPDDDLLDVGCGSGALLQRAARVRHVAGVDASPLQLDLARHRLGARLATGTAELVLGDAEALPWQDGRFSAVASLNCLKFLPDPQRGLREMRRVLQPGGRAVLTLDPAVSDLKSGTIDAYGEWQWSADDARRMMQAAGFIDVSVTQLPARLLKMQLLKGTKPA